MEPLGVGVGPDSKEVYIVKCSKEDIISIIIQHIFSIYSKMIAYLYMMIVKVWVTLRLVSNCTKLLDMINKRTAARRRYPHEKQDESNIAFKMIRDDLPKVRWVIPRHSSTLYASIHLSI